ncbi:MAG: hypothetical protein KAS98_06110 [Deltaproteobacteria bacterium]|jgi:uncharacterized protein YoxC|nr:hypothetical protein [Deltaproteobacteria bacterium]MCK5010039.1 hypothetical protein [Deltaproteobacteria bacterium]MCK5186442.1 hypothetical protein [Deltaproteobacteria bacterium]MCK5256209.1 hypothetical protein [Deltaproteobacteria bacterium]MCK5420956.1 hypothetical protein [Deltaproteobacteria bacterium]
MGTVVNICIIIITIAIVSFIVVLIIALQDVRRVRVKSEKFMDKIEGGLDPILSSVEHISEDIRQITLTARRQLERVDDTADYINKNINAIVENWIKTINLLNDAITDPVLDIAAFLKGLSRGVKFFFDNGRDIKDQ